MGFQGRLGIVPFHQGVSLVLGLFVVKVDRAEGRRGSALASLKVGVHVGIYVVGSLARFDLEIIEMREQVGPGVFVRVLLCVDRAPVVVGLVSFRFVSEELVQEEKIERMSKT